MAIGAFVIGLLGGLIGIGQALQVAGLFRLTQRASAAGGSEALQNWASVEMLTALLGILGAGLALRFRMWGGALLAIAGVLMLLLTSGYAIVPAALLLIAAVLSFLASRSPARTTVVTS